MKRYEKLSLATDVILIITMLVLIWEAFAE
jgi:hypothetical protein